VCCIVAFKFLSLTLLSTGYALRKHIAKALQSRSQAIRTALDRYNTAAAALSPPRPGLSWNNIIEYAFLADFDLLRDSRQDIRERPWATPAARAAMDQYFKIERAREEITRLNIEILRVVTHIRDETRFLLSHEAKVRKTDTGLAHQISLYRNERSRCNEQHMHRFRKLAKRRGFTGSILPGIAVDPYLSVDEAVDSMDVDETEGLMDEQDEQDEQGEDDQAEYDLAAAMYHVLQLSAD
jgi:hypothetical protein